MDGAPTPAQGYRGDEVQGTFEGIVGGAAEQAFEPYFATVNLAVGWRTSRSVAGVRESFAPRLTASVIGGRVLPRGFTAGAYASAIWQGDNSDSDRGASPKVISRR